MNDDKEIKQLHDKLYDYEMELPTDDWDAIAQRLPNAAPHRSISVVWLRRVAAVAVVLLLVGGALIWWSHDTVKDSSTTVIADAQFEAQEHIAEKAELPIVTDRVKSPEKIGNTQKKTSTVNSSSPTNNLLTDTEAGKASQTEQDNRSQIENKPSESLIERQTEPFIEQPIEAETLLAETTSIHEAEITSTDESVLKQTSQLTIEEAERLMAEHHEKLQQVEEENDKPQQSKTDKDWYLGALTSINPSSISNMSSASQPLTSGTSTLGQKDVETKRKGQHDLPVTVGLQVGINLVDNLDLQAGFTYTYLRSRFNMQSDGGLNKRTDLQMLHYMGIPLHLSYRFLNTRYVTLYTSLGGMLEKGISQHVISDIITEDGQVLSHSSNYDGIEGLQWSLNGNVGCAVTLYKGLKLYVEPGVSWYIPNETTPQPESQRTASPWNFNLQCGLRYNFNH